MIKKSNDVCCLYKKLNLSANLTPLVCHNAVQGRFFLYIFLSRWKSSNEYDWANGLIMMTDSLHNHIFCKITNNECQNTTMNRKFLVGF